MLKYTSPLPSLIDLSTQRLSNLPPMSDTHAHTKKNPVTWLIQYFRESAEEIRKISWPSRNDVIKYSMVVIVLCLVLAVFFTGLDWLLSLGIQKLISLKK